MEKALTEKTGGYLIGDVAQMVGLSRDALRFYEKKGIIRADKKGKQVQILFRGMISTD